MVTINEKNDKKAMNKILTFAVLTIGLTLAGCANGGEEEGNGLATKSTLTATATAPDVNTTTRIAYTTTGATKATWESGDIIRLTGNGGYADLALASGEGTSSGSFSGNIQL